MKLLIHLISHIWQFDLYPFSKLPFTSAAKLSFDRNILSRRVLGLRKARWGCFGKARHNNDGLLTCSCASFNISNACFNDGWEVTTNVIWSSICFWRLDSRKFLSTACVLSIWRPTFSELYPLCIKQCFKLVNV